MARIIITFKKDGSTSIRTEGFKGRSCLDATKEIEKALGNVESDKKTEEFYQPNIDLQRIAQADVPNDTEEGE